MEPTVEAYAADIVKRYDEEEFGINADEASKHAVRESVDIQSWNNEGDGYSQEVDLVTLFSSALTDYRNNHNIPSEAERCAVRLTSAYDLLKNYGAIVEGRNTKARMARKDEEVRSLQARLAAVNQRLAELEAELDAVKRRQG